MFFVEADEIVEGDRIKLPSCGEIVLVCDVRPDLDNRGFVRFLFDGGEYTCAYDTWVDVLPNPSLGEVPS